MGPISLSFFDFERFDLPEGNDESTKSRPDTRFIIRYEPIVNKELGHMSSSFFKDGEVPLFVRCVLDLADHLRKLNNFERT